MRRRTLLSLPDSLVVTLLLTPRGVPAGPARGNLMVNPGFEDLAAEGMPGAWQLGGKGSVVEDAARARSGRRFARVRFDDNAAQSLPCEPEVHYAVEGWVRAENPATTEMPRVKVYFLDAKEERALVRLADAAGKTRAEATLPALEPPADVKPKRATVTLRSAQPIQRGWRVVVDPEGRVPEIDEGNNGAAVE